MLNTTEPCPDYNHLWEENQQLIDENRRIEKEWGWMKRVLLAMSWTVWIAWVEGPWYATGDMEELAFFRALRAERIALAAKEEK